MTDNLAWEQANGSGLQALLGYRLVTWEPDRAVVELEVGPQHLNRAGLLHGGVLTTVLDTASGYAGCFCPVPGHIRRTLTLSLTTNYLGQMREGLLRVEARTRGGGRRLYFVDATAIDGDGTPIATSTGTFRYHRGSETAEGTPR
ncbi:PaaI family thioesterase [Caenispirillum bisanense]|uniref:PaaI family thioesterase n=1 Tax=Caenispirillum bisanense TaxID=414052 RepID=UPI0031E10DF5